MARNIGPIVETLLRRVRQEGGLAVNVDLATEIYTRCEQLVNTALERVLATTSLSIPKEKLLHNFRDSISDAISIVSIEESSRELFKCSKISDFAAYDIDWFRKIDGTRFEAWMQISRDLLIIYPGKAAADSVDVTYVKLLTVYTDFQTYYNTASLLPDEDIDIAISLAEMVLLARFRNLNYLPEKLKKFISLARIKGGIKFP